MYSVTRYGLTPMVTTHMAVMVLVIRTPCQRSASSIEVHVWVHNSQSYFTREERLMLLHHRIQSLNLKTVTLCPKGLHVAMSFHQMMAATSGFQTIYLCGGVHKSHCPLNCRNYPTHVVDPDDHLPPRTVEPRKQYVSMQKKDSAVLKPGEYVYIHKRSWSSSTSHAVLLMLLQVATYSVHTEVYQTVCTRQKL